MTPSMKTYLRAEMNSLIKSYMNSERNSSMNAERNKSPSMKSIFGYGFLMCCVYGLYLYNVYIARTRMNALYKKFKEDIEHSDIQRAELGLGKE
jgi:hypothetical protein